MCNDRETTGTDDDPDNSEHDNDKKTEIVKKIKGTTNEKLRVTAKELKDVFQHGTKAAEKKMKEIQQTVDEKQSKAEEQITTENISKIDTVIENIQQQMKFLPVLKENIQKVFLTNLL